MPAQILIDTSALVAFYNKRDQAHPQVRAFLETCRSDLVTTIGCVTETMWLLSPHTTTQNLFLSHLAQSIYICEPLLLEDFARIQALNQQHADLPGDFADLSLVAVSERLNIAEIATLDKDFNVYRRYVARPLLAFYSSYFSLE